MSLESYKKALDAQKEREKEYNVQTDLYSEKRKPKPEPEYVYAESKPSKKRRGFLLPLLIIVILFVVSAIQNPSEKEGKEIVKEFIVEKVNNKLRSEMTNEDNDGLKQFGAFLGMAFASNIIDYVCEIQVHDYIVFSTFDCTTKVEDERKTIISGIIFFGKLIPLKTDIKEEAFETN
jgi:hypothetical protein